MHVVAHRNKLSHPCPKGARCRRRSERTHARQYTHEAEDAEESSEELMPLPQCTLSPCRRKDRVHRTQFRHPCKFGRLCERMQSKRHCQRYSHPEISDEEVCWQCGRKLAMAQFPHEQQREEHPRCQACLRGKTGQWMSRRQLAAHFARVVAWHDSLHDVLLSNHAAEGTAEFLLVKQSPEQREAASWALADDDRVAVAHRDRGQAIRWVVDLGHNVDISAIHVAGDPEDSTSLRNIVVEILSPVETDKVIWASVPLNDSDSPSVSVDVPMPTHVAGRRVSVRKIQIDGRTRNALALRSVQVMGVASVDVLDVAVPSQSLLSQSMIPDQDPSGVLTHLVEHLPLMPPDVLRSLALWRVGNQHLPALNHVRQASQHPMEWWDALSVKAHARFLAHAGGNVSMPRILKVLHDTITAIEESRKSLFLHVHQMNEMLQARYDSLWSCEGADAVRVSLSTGQAPATLITPVIVDATVFDLLRVYLAEVAPELASGASSGSSTLERAAGLEVTSMLNTALPLMLGVRPNPALAHAVHVNDDDDPDAVALVQRQEALAHVLLPAEAHGISYNTTAIGDIVEAWFSRRTGVIAEFHRLQGHGDISHIVLRGVPKSDKLWVFEQQLSPAPSE